MTTNNIESTARPSAVGRPSAQLNKKNKSGVKLAPIGAVLLSLAIGIALGALVTHKLDNPVVAAVNGQTIKLSEFHSRCEAASGTDILAALIKQSLEKQFYQAQGVWPSDSQVDDKVTKDSAQPGFANVLAQSHQTPADYRDAVALQIAQSNLVTKGVQASDADAQAYYQANIDPKNPQSRYYHPEVVRVSVIITTGLKQQDQAVQDLNSGDSFDQVAHLYGTGSAAQTGGMLPPIRRGEAALSKYPGLEQVIFNLKQGQQVDHVKIDGAYWIIRCLAHAPAAVDPYAQVRDDCLSSAAMAKGIQQNGPAVEAAYAAYRQTAKVQIFRPGYQFIAQKLTAPPGQ